MEQSEAVNKKGSKNLSENFLYFCHEIKISSVFHTAWKMFVFGVILVRIFPHSDWISRETPYVSVFSPNAGKYEPE